MREQLLKILEKSPAIYNVLLVLKYRKDVEFMTLVRGLRKNSELIELKENEQEGVFDGILCDIEIGTPQEGFFALVRWTLDALYFCDCFGLRPFVRFSSNTLYWDPMLDPDINPFEYYFEQPAGLDKRALEKTKSYIKYSLRNRLKAEKLNGGVTYQVSEAYINQMAQIMKKHLKFNEKTQKIISEQLEERGVHQNILGVHIRGTDYKSNYKNHPQYVPPEVYYKYIDKALEKYKFEKIYIATDDRDILNMFLERYGQDRVIFSKNTFRSVGVQGAHTAQNAQRQYHRYLLGMEVICDMCALSSCGGLVSSLSQVSLISRIYKKSRNESYLFNKRIDTGINRKGKIFKEVKTIV